MRIDATFIQGLVTSAGDLNTREASIANSISSGVRLNQLSDDPVAAGQAAALATSLNRDDAFLSTSGTVGSRLQASDTALGSVVTQLTSAITTAVGALNNTDNASDRATAAQQLTSIRESLLSLANGSYTGSYLFSGSSTSAPFTEAADGTVTYTGNASTSTIPLLSGGTLQSSLAGSSVFLGTTGSVFGSLNAIISELSTNGTTDTTDAAGLVGNLRDALTAVTSQRAVLDTAQTRLSGESDYITAQKTNLSAQQSTLLTADTASLATQLSAVTTQRSALLSTIAIVEKGSLFDYLQ
jgi:flagellar hook-associated protein 3 FlgL